MSDKFPPQPPPGVYRPPPIPPKSIPNHYNHPPHQQIYQGPPPTNIYHAPPNSMLGTVAYGQPRPIQPPSSSSSYTGAASSISAHLAMSQQLYNHQYMQPQYNVHQTQAHPPGFYPSNTTPVVTTRAIPAHSNWASPCPPMPTPIPMSIPHQQPLGHACPPMPAPAPTPPSHAYVAPPRGFSTLPSTSIASSSSSSSSSKGGAATTSSAATASSGTVSAPIYVAPPIGIGSKKARIAMENAQMTSGDYESLVTSYAPPPKRTRLEEFGEKKKDKESKLKVKRGGKAAKVVASPVKATAAASKDVGGGLSAAMTSLNGDRAARFEREGQELKGNSNKFASDENIQKHYKKVERVLHVSDGHLTEEQLKKLRVKGTCTSLEKEFTRIAMAPNPATVRPPHILVKSLAMLRNKWENALSEGYDSKQLIKEYMWTQLKSVRSDLTVQGVNDQLTVDVYEFHARVSLQVGNLNEYNQCQTMLKHLYASGLKGCENEFLAYRVLYYVYLHSSDTYNGGSADLAHLLAILPQGAREDSAVKHALEVRCAAQSFNYHQLARLYPLTPHLGKCILDLMRSSWQIGTMQRICKAYAPSIPYDFAVKELGFDLVTEKKKAKKFLRKAGAVYTQAQPGQAGTDQVMIDTKKSDIRAFDDDGADLL
jgi:hypothetical protein